MEEEASSEESDEWGFKELLNWSFEFPPVESVYRNGAPEKQARHCPLKIIPNEIILFTISKELKNTEVSLLSLCRLCFSSLNARTRLFQFQNYVYIFET